jgi:hypothetical protein
MRKAFMMIELLLVFSGLILLINLTFAILSQDKESDYVFLTVSKRCTIQCVLEKPIP